MRAFRKAGFRAVVLIVVLCSSCEVFLDDGVGDEGEPCSASGYCFGGLFCQADRCVPKRPLGAECDRSAMCAGELVCGCTTGADPECTCQELGAPDSLCTSSYDCAGGQACYCGRTPSGVDDCGSYQKCKSHGSLDQPCSYPEDDYYSLHPDDGACEANFACLCDGIPCTYSSDTWGVCKPVGDVGQLCIPDEIPCNNDLACVCNGRVLCDKDEMGTCEETGEAGQFCDYKKYPCGDGLGCVCAKSMQCVAGTCEETGGEGQACLGGFSPCDDDMVCLCENQTCLLWGECEQAGGPGQACDVDLAPCNTLGYHCLCDGRDCWGYEWGECEHTGNLGEPCHDVDAPCNATLTCSCGANACHYEWESDYRWGTCEKIGGKGETCFEGLFPCDPGLTCVCDDGYCYDGDEGTCE